MKVRSIFFLFLMMATFLAGCGGQAAANPQNPTLPVATAPTQDLASPPAGSTPVGQPLNAAGEAVVARVNDHEITRDEFERAVERFRQQQMTASDESALQATVLDTLIDQSLIEQAAAAQQVTVSDAEIDAELSAYKETAGSDSAWQQWLDGNRYTQDEFRATLRDSMLTTRMRDLVTQDVNGPVMQVHARHILVETEAEASGLLQRLNSGEDFAALAAQFSRDVTTKDQGGDLGWFSQSELLEPYLSQVAFEIEPGAIAGPVPTSLGFHIIQVIEREERPIPEEKRASVAQNEFENWLASQRREATIERYL